MTRRRRLRVLSRRIRDKREEVRGYNIKASSAKLEEKYLVEEWVELFVDMYSTGEKI